MELPQLLAKMVDQQASDLFISVGAPPIIKVEGKSFSIGNDAITPKQANELVYSVMDDEKTRIFESTLELNMALDIDRVGRFRVNIFRQRGEPALVARYVKATVPSIEALGLPEVLSELIMEERGLVLLVGGTGSGKSTTLASMIDHRNSNRAGHILTVEDPVEFMHTHKKSLVNQREVGVDTLSYENALKNALREAPDVIMIGEVRDLDTMKHAIAYAETGHLCLTTLHANNANQALERILNFYPETAHRQLHLDLSLHLKAIVSQRLAIGINGKRVAAVEVMINTPYISELIQKGHFEKIKDAMTQTEGRIGQTFDEALYKLFKAGKISNEEALRLADSRNNLSLKLRFEKADIDNSTVAAVEVKYDKKASFNQYKTFSVKPISVDKDRRGDMQAILTKAIIFCLIEKGYSQDNENPDINIQYKLGIKSIKGLEILPLMGEADPLSSIKKDSDTHATLLINVIDSAKKKAVWRLTASRKLSGPLKFQEDVNKEILVVMDDFPVAE